MALGDRDNHLARGIIRWHLVTEITTSLVAS